MIERASITDHLSFNQLIIHVEQFIDKCVVRSTLFCFEESVACRFIEFDSCNLYHVYKYAVILLILVDVVVSNYFEIVLNFRKELYFKTF